MNNRKAVGFTTAANYDYARRLLDKKGISNFPNDNTLGILVDPADVDLVEQLLCVNQVDWFYPEEVSS